MKFSFKQSLLLLSSTFCVLTITNNVSAINITKNTSIQGTEAIKKVVLAEAQGDVATNKANSNLGFYHSQFGPTGIFVTKSSTVEINCPETNSSIYAFVGQWGDYANLNEGKTLNPERITLNSGITKFQPTQDGMLYISNQSRDTNVNVEINVVDGIEVPTFNVDETSSEEFYQKINETTSPFVELVGKNVFGTFQIALANDLWKNNIEAVNKINEIIKTWDQIYEYSNYVSGLSLDFDGIAKKHHNRIQIVNPDNGAGYASATNYWVKFQQNSGAGKKLFDNNKNQWGLWHEVGHTYQNPDYNFSGFGEVTVNINSFWVQEEFGFQNRMFTDTKAIAAIKNHINSDNPDKKITDLDVWGRLGVFLQLHMGYGREFFPRLNQEYRLLPPSEKPSGDEAKYQTFIKMASKTANRNLIPFFEKWGIHANEATTKAVGQYPELKTAIWNNIFDGNFEDKAIIDYKLDQYDPVGGVEVKSDAMMDLNVGDKIDNNEVEKYLTGVADDMKIENTIAPNWNSINWDAENIVNSSSVIISQPNKIGNKYLLPTKITANNSIRALGLSDKFKGIFGLNSTEKKFFASTTNDQIHSYFKDKPYITISIVDNQNKEIYTKTANGDQSTSVFQDINNIGYQDNYQIKFWFAEANRGLYYNENKWNKVASKDIGEITFKIVNNNWIIA